MEPIKEKPEEQPVQSPQPGVMDITPPQQQQVSTETPVATAPEPTEAETADKPSSTESTPTDTPTPDTTPLVATPPKQKTHRTPVLAIVSAVIVAGCLAVLAVVAYNKSNEPVATPQNNTAQTDNKATEADVDEAVQEVDQALNSVDDEKDHDTNSINDTSLGL